MPDMTRSSPLASELSANVPISTGIRIAFLGQSNWLHPSGACTRLAKKCLQRVCALIGAVSLLAPALHAEEKCPVEVKLLLSPPSAQTAIGSLGLENERTGRIYLFDTDALDY
jgi:hypothetical protein